MQIATIVREVKAVLHPSACSADAVPECLQQFYNILQREIGISELSFNMRGSRSGLINKWRVNETGYSMVTIPVLRILQRDSSYITASQTIWVINSLQDTLPEWVVPLLDTANFMPTLMMALNTPETHYGLFVFIKNGEFGENDKKLALALKEDCLAFAEVLRHYTPPTQPGMGKLVPPLEEQIGGKLIGITKGLQKVFNRVHFVASTNSPVLLRGETGTGKEVIAKTIHNLSTRKKQPFIAVNCGAIPESLLDSELFGHEKGAFTNAVSQHLGYFEQANGGTILLDEIGELPPSAQTRLLRILQEKKLQRVGGSKTISVDIRVLAATHRDLLSMTQEGTFREDLYYRLRVVEITIPPLRERREDIVDLLEFFLEKHARAMGISADLRIDPQELPFLLEYSWPGNVRELENAVEHALVFSDNGTLHFEEILPGFNLQKDVEKTPEHDLLLDTVTRRHIEYVLQSTKGRVQGPKGAAHILGCHPNTLRKKMQKLGIRYASIREEYKAQAFQQRAYQETAKDFV